MVGDEIRVKAGASLDYESATSHQLSVTVTDAGGLSHTETLNIGVTNQNEAPTDLTVRRHGAGECAAGTVVPRWSHDPDAGSSFTYTLTDDPPASSRWSAMRSVKAAPASTTRAPPRIS